MMAKLCVPAGGSPHDRAGDTSAASQVKRLGMKPPGSNEVVFNSIVAACCPRTRAGSALKFCLVAAGEADFYPRLGPTMEWDTAAGHALLLAAGGRIETLDGDALRYGKPGLRNPDFIVRGR